MALIKKISFVFVFLMCVAFKPFHHGWAEYNQNKVIDYKGIVQELVYENPHATMKVKQNKKIWTVILAPISRMEARGVTVDMLKKGATVQVVGYQHKSIKDEMRAERIIINGNKYELR
jgi:hypothetical protein